MFDRIMRRLRFGWSMAKSSWSVVRQQPKLLVFPLLSWLALALLLASIFVPGGLRSLMARALVDTRNVNLGDDTALLVCIAAYYFALWFITIFFNTALIFSVLRSFETGKVSLREGLSMACYRAPQILAWALIASTIGVMLGLLTNMLKERLGFLGELLGGVFVVTWTTLTYFVTPVLVVEGLGPIGAVRRSSTLLKKTWGEVTGGEFGLGVFAIVLLLPFFLAVLLAFALDFGPAGPAIVAYIGVLNFIGVLVPMSTLSTVLLAALYAFATKGQPPPGFEPGVMTSAFQPRK